MIDVEHSIYDSSTGNTIIINETNCSNFHIKIKTDSGNPVGYFSEDVLDKLILILEKCKNKK